VNKKNSATVTVCITAVNEIYNHLQNEQTFSSFRQGEHDEDEQDHHPAQQQDHYQPPAVRTYTGSAQIYARYWSVGSSPTSGQSNLDETPHRTGLIRGRPIPTLLDSVRVNHDVTPSTAPILVGKSDPTLILYISYRAHISLHSDKHLDWFSRFCKVHGRDQQRHTGHTLLRL